MNMEFISDLCKFKLRNGYTNILFIGIIPHFMTKLACHMTSINLKGNC